MDLNNIRRSSGSGSIRYQDENGKIYYGVEVNGGPNDVQAVVGGVFGFASNDIFKLQEIDLWTTKGGKKYSC